MAKNTYYIETDEQLQRYCLAWENATMLALDTEFIRTDTFYPIAGLLQLSEGESNFLIDPLSIKKWQPFIKLMQDQSIPKVLHSCSEDLEVFDRLWGLLPSPLFDTQIAAAMLGYGFSLSYQRLVEAILGIHVAKGETRSNWLQRPLTESQCHYAALDVEHLSVVYQQLRQQLLDKQRLHWLDEDCGHLLTAFYAPGAYYKKVKSAWKLSLVQLGVLRSLTEWREQQAKVRNIPRGRVLKDKTCYELALKQPQHIGQLGAIAEIGFKTVRVEGETILNIISDAAAIPTSQLPLSLPRPLPVDLNRLMKQLKAIAIAKAEKIQVAPEILIKKRDYEALLRSAQVKGCYSLPPTLQGWRKSIIGDDLLASLLKT